MEKRSGGGEQRKDKPWRQKEERELRTKKRDKNKRKTGSREGKRGSAKEERRWKRGRKAVRRKRRSMKRRKGMRLEGSGEEGAIGKSREEGRHWKKDYMGVKNRIKKGRGKQEGRKCKKGREKGDMGEMGKRKK